MADNSRRDEIPPGTLYMLILRMLARHGEMHGYEIANAIQQVSEDVLQVGVTAGNRRARYYQLTAAGRKQLHTEMAQYQRVSGAIQKILQTA
jgi:PadR family transcriptional regulator PadR